jgi:hypothetical protein
LDVGFEAETSEVFGISTQPMSQRKVKLKIYLFLICSNNCVKIFETGDDHFGMVADMT